jgi:hypothetical protein
VPLVVLNSVSGQRNGQRSAAYSALDWLLCDRTTGRWTVMQRPNLPLVLFVVLRIGALVIGGRVGNVLQWVGTAALAWWAVDEITRGVNPFRRILGAVVLGFILVGTVAALR